MCLCVCLCWAQKQDNQLQDGKPSGFRSFLYFNSELYSSFKDTFHFPVVFICFQSFIFLIRDIGLPNKFWFSIQVVENRICTSHQIWKIFSHFFKYFNAPFPFWDSTHILAHLVLSHMFTFLSLFFLLQFGDFILI